MPWLEAFAPGRPFHRRIFALTGGETNLRPCARRFLASLLAAAACHAVACRGVRASRKTGHSSSRRKSCRMSRAATARHNLDFLFGALKAAPDDETAKAVEQRIWALWVVSRSDTTNLLMTRVQHGGRGQGHRSGDQAARRHRQDQTGLCRRLEPARHALLHEKGLRPFARRHPRGAEARAAPLRRAVRPRPHSAGHRRRQGRARSLSPRARGLSAAAERFPTW